MIPCLDSCRLRYWGQILGTPKTNADVATAPNANPRTHRIALPSRPLQQKTMPCKLSAFHADGSLATRLTYFELPFVRIAGRIQVMPKGGLSEQARRRPLAIAKDADLRIRSPKTKFGPDVTPDSSSVSSRRVAGTLDPRHCLGGPQWNANTRAAESF
jgi:hypothetical protein